MACGKKKAEGLELHKRRKRKISKCVGMWFNAIGSIFIFRHALCLHDHVTGHVVCRHSFILELVRERDSIIIHLLAYPMGALLLSLLPYFTLLFPFTLLPFLFSLLSLPSCTPKINLIYLSYSYEQNYSGLKKLFLLASHSILSPPESKRCPLTLASVLACAGSVDELRF